MRILHVCAHHWFEFGRKPHTQDRRISSGLTRLGHFVYDFSYRDIASYHSLFRKRKRGRSKMNASLLTAIERLEPDLLLLGHSELIDEPTLAFIRRRYPQTRLAMWYVDALYKAPGFEDKLQHLDAFFATGAGEPLEQLRAKTSGVVHFMPNMCDPGLDSFRADENPAPRYDLTFIGSSAGGQRLNLTSILTRELEGLELGFFGLTKGSKKLDLNYLQLIGDSAMGLNYSRHNDQPLYTSDRQIHLAANGAMVLMPEVPDFRWLFSDEELVYFTDIPDLVEKARHYAHSPDERRAIARRGRLRAHDSYNATRVCRFMLEAINHEPFSEPYEWVNPAAD
ncbi:glycosyltransferase [Marinobacteraceae bacterium S3BR75-40.1]